MKISMPINIHILKRLLVNIQTLKRGLILLFVASPVLAIPYILLTLANGLFPVLQVGLMRSIVIELTVTDTHNHVDQPKTLLLAGAYALAFLIPLIIEPFEGLVIANMQRRTVAALDQHIMQASTRMIDLTAIEKPAFHDTINTLQSSLFSMYWLWIRLRNFSRMAITLTGLLILLAQLHPLLPLILAIAALPQLRTEWYHYQHQWDTLVDRSQTSREMIYSTEILTDEIAAKEVRVFGLGDFFLQRFRQKSQEGLQVMQRLQLRQIRRALLNGTIYMLALGAGFWYVASQATVGHLTTGDIALYISTLLTAQGRLTILAGAFGEINSSILALKQLFAFLDTASPYSMLSDAENSFSLEKQPIADITMKNLSFSYPESSTSALENINTTLPQGKLTALVGENGAGKSTFAKLLTRLYDPTAGTITVNDQILASYDLSDWRAHIAMVPQDFARFSLTLDENIRLGIVALKRPGLSLIKAARLSGVDEIVSKLPDGYETQLTHRFEGGVDLSGGEWQKIALARAIIRDADLIILDEPTAALDAEAEYKLFEHIKLLIADKTAVIISHRFSTVRQADQILVIENGQLLEAGNHTTLMAKGEKYATLYKMQAGRYM